MVSIIIHEAKNFIEIGRRNGSFSISFCTTFICRKHNIIKWYRRCRKTYFARELISTCLHDINALEDIPSPTFTLVQTYELKNVDIWHADLYRLSNLSEIYELGLDTAFDTAVCLLEWPNRLGEMLPKNALTLNFDITEEDFREISLYWKDVMWDKIVKNALKVFNNEKP